MYMKDKNPTEHEIIQMAILPEDNIQDSKPSEQLTFFGFSKLTLTFAMNPSPSIQPQRD